MTGRDKIENAFDKSGSNEIAAVICHESIFIRDHWNELFDYPWWYQETPDIEKQVKWRSEFIEMINQDWFRVNLCSSIEESENIYIEPGNGEVHLIDRRIQKRSVIEEPQKGGMKKAADTDNVENNKELSSCEDIDEFISDKYLHTPETVIEEGRDRVAKVLTKEFCKKYYPIYYMATPICRCYGLWGFEDMMLKIATNPELVKYACRKYLEAGIREVLIAKALGAEAIWVEEYFTDIISPEAFKDIGIKYSVELFDEIKALDMKSMYYFTGNPAGKMDLILSAEADALVFEESKKGFSLDIENLADNIKGKCTLLGNLDAIGILQDGSEEQLQKEISRQLLAGRKNGNRFIMNIGSPVTPSTSVERVKLYLKMSQSGAVFI